RRGKEAAERERYGPSFRARRSMERNSEEPTKPAGASLLNSAQRIGDAAVRRDTVVLCQIQSFAGDRPRPGRKEESGGEAFRSPGRSRARRRHGGSRLGGRQQ